MANGSCHSIEGIKLEELGLKAGEAKLLVRGSLLGAAQDASIILTDFPVAVLQPLFRALPALEHATPAVAAASKIATTLQHSWICHMSVNIAHLQFRVLSSASWLPCKDSCYSRLLVAGWTSAKA